MSSKVELTDLVAGGKPTPEQQQRFVDYVMSKIPMAEKATVVCMRCGKRRPLLAEPESCDCEEEP